MEELKALARDAKTEAARAAVKKDLLDEADLWGVGTAERKEIEVMNMFLDQDAEADGSSAKAEGKA